MEFHLNEMYKMKLSTRLTINIQVDDIGIDFPLNNVEWRQLQKMVSRLGGMIYVEPPTFKSAHICSSITKKALEHVLLEKKQMVVIV